MIEYPDCVHLIARLPDPVGAVKRILRRPEPRCTIVDLSAGQLSTPSLVREEATPLLAASDKKVQWIDGQQFAPEVGDASREDYVEWLSNASNQKLAGGKTIKEWFTYKGEISMWWFTEVSAKHPVKQPHRWLFFQIHVLRLLCNRCELDRTEWHIWSPDDATGAALRTALSSPKSATVHHLYPSKDSSIKDQLRRRLRAIPCGEVLLTIFRMLRKATRLYQEVAFSKKTFRSSQQGHLHLEGSSGQPLVLIHTTFPRSWKEADPSEQFDSEVVAFDRYFGDAPWRLRASGFRVAWLPTVSHSNYSQWQEASGAQTLPDAVPWMMLTWRKALAIFYHQVKWLLCYLWLFVIRRVYKQWSYDGIPLGYWIKANYLSLPTNIGAPVRIEKYRSACEVLKPDAVLYRNEFYRSGRKITAALKGQAALVAMQHGMISRDHTVYQWRRGDIRFPVVGTPRDHIRYAPVPDWFAAFGTYYIELFDQWEGYPAERVVPTGGFRHDMLVDRFKLQDSNSERSNVKRALRKEIGLPTEMPVILLCTGLSFQAGIWFRMIIEALQGEGLEAFVAAKLHQYHGGAEYIKREAQKKSFKAFSIYEKGVYPLMAAADILVSGTSTTILEGNLFGLQPIAIVANEDYESYPFSQDNVACPVVDAGSMAQALRKVLSSSALEISDTSELLVRHLRNGDGQACQRLANCIHSAIST